MSKNGYIKQTYLDTLLCNHTSDVPFFGPPYRAAMGLYDAFERGPHGGGYDGFGVWWNHSPDGAVPSNQNFLLEDICDWENIIHFPDLNAIDWTSKAQKDLAPYDRNNQVIEYCMGNGHFERLIALMGFEEGLCAILTEPDTVKAYMEAYTDYRIAYAHKVAQYYNPDIITSYDDVATDRATFMSRSCYQELIKPYHKKFNDEVKKLGIIPVQHCCGKAESLIEDFIEEGARCWCSVQPDNDIPNLLKQYGNQISICGGFDVNKLAQMGKFTENDIRQVVRECIDRCAIHGSFILGNFTLSATHMTWIEIGQIISDEAMKYGRNYYNHRLSLK